MLEESPRADGLLGNEASEELSVHRPNAGSAVITWRFNWNQAKQKQKCIQSKYVEVGGKDCRLLVYPFGELLAAHQAGRWSLVISVRASRQGNAVVCAHHYDAFGVLRTRRSVLAGCIAWNQAP